MALIGAANGVEWPLVVAGALVPAGLPRGLGGGATGRQPAHGQEAPRP